MTDLSAALIEPSPPPLRPYTGFPFWHALLVEAGHEIKSAEWLARVRVSAYVPIYAKQINLRGRAHGARLFAMLPGMLLVPCEMMDIPRRAEVFELCRVYGFVRTAGGHPAMLTKADVEVIRRIESDLNRVPLEPEADWRKWKIGDQAKFKDATYAAFFGYGTIFEIANEGRIGLEVVKLFGRKTRVYVAASGIEAM